MKLLYGLRQKDWTDTVFDRTQLILFRQCLFSKITLLVIIFGLISPSGPHDKNYYQDYCYYFAVIAW